MYVAPGLLDQRIRFYSRGENGADGFARPVYVFTTERWGRIDDTAARQSVPLSPQAHVEARYDAILMCARDIVVDPWGVVQHGNTLYYVRGVVDTRQVQVQRIALERINPTAYAEFAIFDGDEVLDGTHLLTPGE